MRLRTTLGRLSAALLAVAAVAWFPGTAAAVPQFASAETATIFPGAQTDAAGQCTSNFVFTNGTDVFLGQAAHCAGTGGDATSTDGCNSPSMPIGAPVTVQGASRPATLAYSSWLTMQQIGETNLETCLGNDFALIKLDPADAAATNPSLRVLGGPAGLDTDGVEPGEAIYSYGNSSLRGGIRELSPKSGVALESINGGWTHNVVTVTPGIPGDSGSGYLSQNGEAFGVLSTLSFAPVPGLNGVVDLSRAMNYANTHGGLGTLTLVPGTESFRGTPLSFLGGLGG